MIEAPVNVACRNCGDTGWVCEEHLDHPWSGVRTHPEACEHGAGAPCPCCQPAMAAAGYVDRREKAIASWLENKGYRQIASALRNGEHWGVMPVLESPV